MKNNYCNIDEEIAFICKNQYEYFLKKSNVVGLGLGYRIQNGFYTCEKCIQVFVSKKLPSNQISVYDMVPSNFKGIKTDIIETGVFTAYSLRKRIRPVKGGYNIGPDGMPLEGSAGCLVSNGVSNFALSTNHLLADQNRLEIGHSILQPSFKFNGRAPKDVIGTLHRFVPLRFIEGTHRPINFSDTAMALLSTPNILSPKIAFIGNLRGVKSPVLNATVEKVGSRTERTTGIIRNTDVTLENVYLDGRRALFQNVIATSKMAMPGDSGAVLVNENKYAVGLLYGGGNTIDVFSRMDTVLSQLDVHIVT